MLQLLLLCSLLVSFYHSKWSVTVNYSFPEHPFRLQHLPGKPDGFKARYVSLWEPKHESRASLCKKILALGSWQWL